MKLLDIEHGCYFLCAFWGFSLMEKPTRLKPFVAFSSPDCHLQNILWHGPIKKQGIFPITSGLKMAPWKLIKLVHCLDNLMLWILTITQDMWLLILRLVEHFSTILLSPQRTLLQILWFYGSMEVCISTNMMHGFGPWAFFLLIISIN